MTVTRAGSRMNGRFAPLTEFGVVHVHNEKVLANQPSVLGYRVALNLLGDGYVEAISDETLVSLAEHQRILSHGVVHGEPSKVFRADLTATSVGRFGWKAQHASIRGAAAEALYSELGVPNESIYHTPAESPEDAGQRREAEKQLDAVVAFLRSTSPTSPDAERQVTESASAGASLFDQVGCSVCHQPTLRTAPAGTKLAGGSVTVSAALGDREIHPYSDFLLHDVGTGDGIIQNVRPEDYNESSANKFRTAPLWGVRFRSWLMHDGKAVTYHQAIMRHAGEAADVVKKYQDLTPVEKEQLRMFLDSL